MPSRVLVVGGAGGIGSAVVRRLAEAGMHVIIGDIDRDAGETLQRDAGSRVTFHAVDVRRTSSISCMLTGIRERHGGLDHLVSLAGGATPKDFEGLLAMEDEEIEASLRINLQSHLLLAKYVAPLLEASAEQDRSITFVSSINAKMDFGLPVYSSAKAGLIGATKTLAAEYGRLGIRVNVILVGTVSTPRTEAEPKALQEYLAGSLLDRFATPSEVADVIYAIIRHMSCVTGQEIVADCGQTVKGHYRHKRSEER